MAPASTAHRPSLAPCMASSIDGAISQVSSDLDRAFVVFHQSTKRHFVRHSSITSSGHLAGDRVLYLTSPRTTTIRRSFVRRSRGLKRLFDEPLIERTPNMQSCDDATTHAARLPCCCCVVVVVVVCHGAPVHDAAAPDIHRLTSSSFYRWTSGQTCCARCPEQNKTRRRFVNATWVVLAMPV